MKKKIIIGLLMVSALSFGAVNNNTNNNSQRGSYHNQMMSNLSEKQQTELTNMMKDRREVNYKKGLDMRSKQLELEKLLAEDKVNWKNVEKVNKQISDMKGKQRLENMKFRSNIEDKYGISMGRKGMKGFGSMDGKSMKKSGHTGNGMNNSGHGHKNN